MHTIYGQIWNCILYISKKKCTQKQQGLTILDAANKLQTPIQKMLFINTTNPVVFV